MINSSQKDRVIAVLTKHGLNEQKMSKNMFCKEDNSGISADLTGKEPIVGMMINGIVQTEGNSNAEITEIQREVAAVMKPRSHSPVIDLSAPSKEAAKGSNPASGGINKDSELKGNKAANDVMKESIPSELKLGTGDTKNKEYWLRHPPGDPIEPPIDKEKLKEALGKIDTLRANKLVEEAKKGTTTATTATCQGCSSVIHGTIAEFERIDLEYGGIYCLNCVETGKQHDIKDQKVAGNVSATPAKQEAKPLNIPKCRKCGVEVAHARALACMGNDEPCTCEECGEKQESKHKEAQKGKDAPVEKREARSEEPKRAEVFRMSAQKQPDALIPMRSYIPQGSIIKGFVPSLKEIGKIKIGKKGEVRQKLGGGTYRLPEKIDHFEIVGLIKDEKGDFPPDPIMDLLGANTKELNIFLLYNDLTLNFPTRYNAYKGGKCMCRGDGQKAITTDGDEIECNPETCPTFKEKGCKLNGILSCVLADAPMLGGVYKFRTTSFYSVRSILSSLMYISTLTGGILSMIPLKLTVTPMQVTPDGKLLTVYIVNIVFPGTMNQLLDSTVKVSQYQSGMRSQIQQLEATRKLELAQPESEEEQREFNEEFIPNTMGVK